MARDDNSMKLQCYRIYPSIARLYAERAVYERADRPRAVITAADIEAELAEIERRFKRVR